jgi:hypothetical protein
VLTSAFCGFRVVWLEEHLCWYRQHECATCQYAGAGGCHFNSNHNPNSKVSMSVPLANMVPTTLIPLLTFRYFVHLDALYDMMTSLPNSGTFSFFILATVHLMPAPVPNATWCNGTLSDDDAASQGCAVLLFCTWFCARG